MPILAVGPSVFQKKLNQKADKNYVSGGQNLASSQMDFLNDYGYGRSMVKNNGVSFKGAPGTLVADLSKKVSAVFNSLGMNDILLVGKDLNTAKTQLRDSVGALKTVVKKIVFIPDEKITNSILIKKSIEGYDEVRNLSETPLYVSGGTRKQPVFLKKGEATFFMDEDYVFAKNPEYGFKVTASEKSGITDFPQEAIQQFDVGDESVKAINELNSKNVAKLGLVSQNIDTHKVTFEDVGGQDPAIEEIRKSILFQVKHPAFFAKNKIPSSKGSLFVGPPGNGKSLAAKALSNEAGVNYMDVDGQMFRTKWYGESGHNIHGFYEELRKNQPCVAFLDEADAIFRARSEDSPFTSDDLNVHLREITKLAEDNAQVYLVAATNRPELIDPAILRRFRTKIEFTNLDSVERCQAVFDIHSKGVKIDDFDKAKFMNELKKADCSGDDVANVVLEAKSASMERQGVFETMRNGTFADSPDFELVLTGEDFEKSLKRLLDQRKLVAGYSKEFVIKPFGQD